MVNNAIHRIIALFMLGLYFTEAGANENKASVVFGVASLSSVIVLGKQSGLDGANLGSGVVISKNTVATNCHTIKNASNITIRHSGKTSKARLTYADWDRDFCILESNSLKAQPIKKIRTTGLVVGEPVYAIGAPEGLDLTISDGIISGLRPTKNAQYIQTTAPVSHGSSGGGLFDENGNLIGLITFNLKDGQNLNFAIPISWIIDAGYGEQPNSHANLSILKPYIGLWSRVFCAGGSAYREAIHITNNGTAYYVVAPHSLCGIEGLHEWKCNSSNPYKDSRCKLDQHSDRITLSCSGYPTPYISIEPFRDGLIILNYSILRRFVHTNQNDDPNYIDLADFPHVCP